MGPEQIRKCFGPVIVAGPSQGAGCSDSDAAYGRQLRTSSNMPLRRKRQTNRTEDAKAKNVCGIFAD